MLFSKVLSIALMVLGAIAAPPPFTASNLASRTFEHLHNHRHHREKTISAPLPFTTMTTAASALPSAIPSAIPFSIPSAIHRRTTTVPSTCSTICNNAMNEAQDTEASGLCEAGSAFQLDLSACKACVAAQAAQGGNGEHTTILPGDFMTMCQVTTTVPTTCSTICNNAMNEAQDTETSALCEAGSAFQLDLSACKACVAAQGGNGEHTTILPGDFMTICPVTIAVPTTCSMVCTNAMVAAPSNETSALCEAGSAFQLDLSACKACVAAQAAQGGNGGHATILSGDFMTICSETGTVGAPPAKAPTGPVVASSAPKVSHSCRSILRIFRLCVLV